jgi:hypothetical protein
VAALDGGVRGFELVHSSGSSSAASCLHPSFAADQGPLQFYLGAVQDMELDVAPIPRLTIAPLRQMGQALFYPPNVRGWVGGRQWINSATLTARRQFVESLFAPIDENTLNADEQIELVAARSNGITLHGSGRPLPHTDGLTAAIQLEPSARSTAAGILTILRQFIASANDRNSDCVARRAAVTLSNLPNTNSLTRSPGRTLSPFLPTTRREFLEFPAGNRAARLQPVRPQFLVESALATRTEKDQRPILVQLAGGNDGLNTLIPLGADYYRLRPTLGPGQGPPHDRHIGLHHRTACPLFGTANSRWCRTSGIKSHRSISAHRDLSRSGSDELPPRVGFSGFSTMPAREFGGLTIHSRFT